MEFERKKMRFLELCLQLAKYLMQVSTKFFLLQCIEKSFTQAGTRTAHEHNSNKNQRFVKSTVCYVGFMRLSGEKTFFRIWFMFKCGSGRAQAPISLSELSSLLSFTHCSLVWSIKCDRITVGFMGTGERMLFKSY